MRRSLLFLVFSCLALSACAQTPQLITKQRDPGTGPFLIGTGTAARLYHFLGQEICRNYAQDYAVDSSTCDTLVQRKSETKLRLLQSKKLDLAIVDSAWVRSAANGIGPFTNTGPMNDLRGVMSFYAQPLTVVVKRNSEITEFAQLTNARLISTGYSYNDAPFSLLRNMKGWTDASFASLEKVESLSTALDAFCEGKADALVATSAHPSGFIRRATAECGGRILPIEDPKIAGEIADNPAIALASIPPKLYVGQPGRIPTFGHRTLLIARSDTPDAVVEAVVNAVLDNLSDMKKRHPAFLEFNPREMVSSGLPVPLHPAAEAIYRREGILR